MYREAGAARFLIQDLITRRASNIRVRRRMHSVHRSLHRAAYSGAPMEKSCEPDSGLRNAQGRTLSVSQNDLGAFFDFTEILHARIDLEGSDVAGRTRQRNLTLLDVDRFHVARHFYGPDLHSAWF